MSHQQPFRTRHIALSAEAETLQLGLQLAHAITSGAVIYLYGALGAGKTTLARGMLRGFGYQGKVKSPTYTLVEPYQIKDRFIYHFDFYRLQSPNDLQQIGIQEYFTPTSITLIEWPEKAFPLLPEPDLACYIESVDNGRKIRIKANTPRGDSLLQHLK